MSHYTPRKNSILSLPRYEQKSGAQPQLYTPFVLRTLVDSDFVREGTGLLTDQPFFYAPLYPERKMSFAPMGASAPGREGKRTHPLLHLARDDKERASFIDEQRIPRFIAVFTDWSQSNGVCLRQKGRGWEVVCPVH
ncbi:UNVERIFIED_CONTAM: putative cytochrome c biosynthesis protein [Sesamum radiatum]|uniref:Cytochrome c biosynthesis protein n=1 Tax=Sesamum radiatum TaxID=300843 RepID=A0AAW2SLP2_SESRA